MVKEEKSHIYNSTAPQKLNIAVEIMNVFETTEISVHYLDIVVLRTRTAISVSFIST